MVERAYVRRLNSWSSSATNLGRFWTCEFSTPGLIWKGEDGTKSLHDSLDIHLANNYWASYCVLAALIWANLGNDMRVSQLLLAFVCSMEFWRGPLGRVPSFEGLLDWSWEGMGKEKKKPVTNEGEGRMSFWGESYGKEGESSPMRYWGQLTAEGNRDWKRYC